MVSYAGIVDFVDEAPYVGRTLWRSLSAPPQLTTRTYDAARRPIREEDQSGFVTSEITFVAWDGIGRATRGVLRQSSNPGQEPVPVSFSYDDAGRSFTRTIGPSVLTVFEDSNGNVLRVVYTYPGVTSEVIYTVVATELVCK